MITRGRVSAWVLLGLQSSLVACMAIEPQRLGSGPPVLSPTKFLAFSRAPVTREEARFALLNITGAPAGLVIKFEKAMHIEAETRRLTLVPEGDPTATYRVRSYLSALGDSHSTLLVYVLDVFGADGQHLHRIIGQEPGAGSGTDPWLGIDDVAMAAAAQRSVDRLSDWVTPQ